MILHTAAHSVATILAVDAPTSTGGGGGPRAAFQNYFVAFAAVLGIAALVAGLTGKTNRMFGLLGALAVGSMFAFITEGALSSIGTGVGGIVTWAAGQL